PLELFQNSYLGVPGLLQAVRAGNVAVANALGSGVLQAPGMMPYLPALCRHLLGEELKLPSVQTWWCGDAASRAYVLEHLSDLVIKSAFPTRGEDPVFGSDLSRDNRGTLIEKINARPEKFVAQRRVMECTTPALTEERIHPRRFVIRAYLAASGDSYTAMHGGLTRVTGSETSMLVSLQKGAGSKDTWILADGPVSEVSLLPTADRPVALSRGGGDLPSRIADDLFWLGRYVERTEGLGRLARGTLARLIEHSSTERTHAVETLAGCLLWPGTAAAPAELDRAIVGMLFDPTSAWSLRAHANSVHRLARVLRDQISIDAWRILQSIWHTVTAFKPSTLEPTNDLPELLDQLLAECAAFSGLVADSMTRGQAWLFVDLGRRVERTVVTLQLLRDTLIDGVDDSALLETVLEITDSSVTYRRRYLTHLEAHAIADLLLADETNPRAVAFQLAEINRHVVALPHDSTPVQQRSDHNIVLRMRSSIQLADLAAICSASTGRRVALDTLLTQTLDQCNQLTQAITQLYFSHAPIPRGLDGMTGDDEG
ncbi:MAG: circularly permuted type 2 ATP-grasp protein, partial [Burkholderiales bacterium]|nr:circularly permuted type 2 ATP-grasp protein [Phycisphaerae bacterium]